MHVELLKKLKEQEVLKLKMGVDSPHLVNMLMLIQIKYLTKKATVFPVPVLALARTSLPGNMICKSYQLMEKGIDIKAGQLQCSTTNEDT